MARKSAALLPNAPVVLGKDAKANLKAMASITVPEGTEEQYERWVAATRAVEEQGVRVDALQALVDKKHDKGSDSEYWPAYQVALRRYQRLISAALGACDVWVFARDHKDDRIGVAEDELRAVVIDSLSDKLDGLKFSINNGMLGSKIAQAIRKLTSEESAGEATYCQDCK